MKKRAGTHMVDSAALLAEGKPHAAKFMNALESIWNIKRSNDKMDLHNWLNYRNKITMQNVDAPLVLIYNTSGTNLAAALYIRDDQKDKIIKTNGFVAESVTYYEYLDRIEEGDYLCAFLNSTIVNDLIKAFQPQGLWGPRHIHRRPFEVCHIPEFDPNISKHTELSKLGEECRIKMAKFAPQLFGRLGTMRTDARKLIKDEINKINKLANILLNEQGQKVKAQSSIKKKTDQSELFN
jgi:hypothetical protein